MVAARKGPRAHPPSLGLPWMVSEQLVSVSEALSEDRSGVSCGWCDARGRSGPSAAHLNAPHRGCPLGSLRGQLVTCWWPGGHWLGGESHSQAQTPLNKAFFWDEPRKMHFSCTLSPRTGAFRQILRLLLGRAGQGARCGSSSVL